VDIYRIEEQTSTSSSTFLPSSSATSDASADIINCSSVSYDVESNDTEVEMEKASDVSKGCSSQPRLRLSQQRHRLQNVAKASDRYALLDQDVALITSDVLQDYEIVTTKNSCRYKLSVQAVSASTASELKSTIEWTRLSVMKEWMKNDGGGTHIVSAGTRFYFFRSRYTHASASAVVIKQSIVAFIEESHILCR